MDGALFSRVILSGEGKYQKIRSDFKDLTGMKLGKLKVLSLHSNRHNSQTLWNCLCDCGTTSQIRGDVLRRGQKTCGCVHRLPKFNRFDELVRFFLLVNIRGENECWEWKGGKSPKGYGVFNSNYKNPLAHRLIILSMRGHLKQSEYVCHKCDNPICVNPNHLFIGDAKSNYDDSRSKGRHTFGEKQGHSKLKEHQVIDIKKRRMAGEKLSSLAAQYNVDVANISSIARGKSWTHVKI